MLHLLLRSLKPKAAPFRVSASFMFAVLPSDSIGLQAVMFMPGVADFVLCVRWMSRACVQDHSGVFEPLHLQCFYVDIGKR